MVLRRVGVLALCGLLVQPQFLSAEKKAKPGKISGEARIRFALSRFTFGPKSGDVQAVQRIGLDSWFEQQLHPASLDNAVMETRLADYPAMKLSTAKLMERFPSPQMIRVLDRTGAALPADPVEHVIYEDQLAFYRMKNAEKQGAAPDAEKNKTGDTEEIKKQVRDLLLLTPEERFQNILAMKPEELAALRNAMNPQRLPVLVAGMTAEQKETLAALGGSERVVGAELMEQRLIREIYSTHQLEEVMTSFWMNHFNVYLRKSQEEPYLLPSLERDVIRPRAMGKFEDLLVAVAQSPAMLVYLDNFQSTGPASPAAARGKFVRANMAPPTGLNENYARELMELHTVGVNGGYTQKDVTEVAKVFTGWTIDRPLQGGDYNFNNRRHEPGPKTVLGKTIPESGEQEGLEVLHMLATSPATAHFIAQKLAERFVSDHPPAALVNKMAAAFLKSQGDIRTVLKTMFKAPEFWSNSNEGAKFKTPEEFVVSAVRASGAEVQSPLPLVQALNTLGMPLYGAQPPTGYKWDQETWLNTAALVNRMNFGIQLSHGSMRGVSVSPAAVPQGLSDTAKELVLEKVLLGHEAGSGTRKTVMEQFQSANLQQQAEKGTGQKGRPFQEAAARFATDVPQLDNETANMIGLLIGSPEFQRR